MRDFVAVYFSQLIYIIYLHLQIYDDSLQLISYREENMLSFFTIFNS